MKKILFSAIILTALISFGQTNNTKLDFSSMPQNSMAILVEGDEKLQLLKTEKAWYSAGENLSKISIKGSETEVKIPKGKSITIYTKGISKSEGMPFSIVKLTNNGKKRFANFNIVSGKKIASFAFTAKQINSNEMIYKINPNTALAVGEYCLIFKRVSKGNFYIKTISGAGRLKNNPCFIEIVE
jgi:hypothetical protein